MVLEAPILMFELQPTPPLSPLSDQCDAMVPQLPGHAEPSTVIGGATDGPSDWSNLYALMNEIPAFGCGAGAAVVCAGDGLDLDAAMSDSTPATSRAGSPWAAGELADAFAPRHAQTVPRSPSPSPASSPSPPGSPRAAVAARRPSARIKARGGARRIKREPGLGAVAAAAARVSAGVLPAGHKPARGRGRQLQLATMSKEQKAAEAKARLEKNRQAAREFRMRRKEHVVELEHKVDRYEVRDRKQAAEIAKLQAQVAWLQQQLAAARRGC